jgi:phytoene/squalene synthetase
MGLVEDRALEAFQTFAYPRLENQIQALVGFEIPIEVDWDSLAEGGFANVYTHNFTNVYFTPLIHALQQIAVDGQGREALRTRLQRIVVKNDSRNFEASALAVLEKGILILDHAPNSNVEDVNQRVQVIIEAIELGL